MPTRTARISLEGKYLSRLAGTPQAITGLADSFDLAKAQVTSEFVILTDRDAIELHSAAFSEESAATPSEKAAATALLMRAQAPLALKHAVVTAHRHQSFTAAHACATLALSRCIARWNPKGGLKLGSFITHVLPVEAERQRKDDELLTSDSWTQISVRSAMTTIEVCERNQLHLTGYHLNEGRTVILGSGSGKQRTVRFPLTVQTDDQPVVNPQLTWQHTKLHVRKVFRATTNWGRKTQKAKTGYKLSDLACSSAEFYSTTLGTKNTSRAVRARVFGKPFRAVREHEITPVMVQRCMRRDRELRQQDFDHNAWSIQRIARIMENLHTITSYDQVFEDDEGNETRVSDLMEAPVSEASDRVIHTRILDDLTEEDYEEPEFDPQQLRDAEHIVQRLQESGLWDEAIKLPLHKFLNAYEQGRPGFCTLCSRYGIRVSWAIKIMKVITAHLA